MHDDLSQVQAYVHRLVRRERRLLVASLLLRGLSLGAALLAGAAVAVERGADRAAAGAALVVGGGALSLAAIGWPLVRRWAASGDLGRQARRVERLEPGLRGRLLTVVERPDGPRGQESAAILSLVARRALALTARLDERLVHPARSVVRHAAATAALLVMALILTAAAPGGSSGVWAWWLGGPEAVAAARLGEAAATARAARVGDLTLRYVYPAYTGLEPYEVVNSTGEAHGPPGTRVEVIARSATPVDSASVVAYDEPALDALVTDERMISGSFVIQPREGTYQLLTFEDGEAASSPAFPILVEPDLAPEVTVTAAEAEGGVVEVPADGWLVLDWIAKDDFGIDRVVLEVDGKERGADLFRARERRAEVTERYQARPVDLGMQVGETYEVVVAAWDNDTVSGTKVGRSHTLEVVITGEAGARDLSPADLDALIVLMVGALGDHLEEAFPPGRAEGDYAAWGERVNRRYEPLATFLEDALGSRGMRRVRWKPLMDALDTGRSLVRFTQVSFQHGSTSDAAKALGRSDGERGEVLGWALSPGGSVRAQAVNAVSLDIVVQLRDAAILALEDAILHLDAIKAAAAMLAVSREVGELASEADELRSEFAEGADPQQLLAAADALREYLQHLEEIADDLPEGGLKDLVAGRAAEMEALLEELRGDVARGELDRAREMTDRLARQMDDLAEAIAADLARRKERSEQQGKDLEELLEELERIATEEGALAQQLSEIRDQSGVAEKQQVVDLWQRITDAVSALQEEVGAFATDLEEAERAFDEQEYVRAVQEAADRLAESVYVRDVSEALFESVNMGTWWQRYQGRFERGWRSVGKGPAPARYQAVAADIDAITELLEQLRRVDTSGGAEARARVAALEDAQQTLRGDLAAATDKAVELAQMMPVTPHGMEEALDAAGRRMEQAGSELVQGQGMQAEGSQLAAQRHVREAIEAIKEAMSAAAQQAAGGGGGSGGSEGDEPEGGGREGDDEQPSRAEFELPEPEEFRTPEEFRRLLLQGMAGEVPDEYRALKRRYYEELVHQ